jgi:hypothetical protein
MSTDLRTLLANLKPDTATIDIVSNVGASYSPWTGGGQFTELPGAKWKMAWTYNALDSIEGRVMKAVKAMMKGGAEVCHVRDFAYMARRTVEPGAPVVGPGVVLGVAITAPGAGYTVAPAVVFTGGGGAGAAATAVIDGGKVVEINVTAPGAGYTSAPAVSFTGGGGGAGATATASAGQAGAVLTITGCTPSAPAYAIGDQVSYLSVDGMYRMHMATANVNADATGKVLLPILPPIRNAPTFGAGVDSLTPSVSVNLTDGGAVTIDGVVHSLSWTLTEALYGIL